MSLSQTDLLANIVYCDGACSGNPGPGGWGTIVVQPRGNVTELGGGDQETTNNRMEMIAALQGLNFLRAAPEPIILFTDSTYLIQGITQWVWGWRQRGWQTSEGKEVANQDLWQELMRVVGARPKAAAIDWRYVRGHTGVAGNERVDTIAVAFTKGQKPNLYRGPLLGYDVAVYDLPTQGELPPRREKKPKQAAYSYLSLVNGVLMRHATWPECERRVKGVAGAKFKKAVSEADERLIMQAWGVNR